MYGLYKMIDAFYMYEWYRTIYSFWNLRYLFSKLILPVYVEWHSSSNISNVVYLLSEIKQWMSNYSTANKFFAFLAGNSWAGLSAERPLPARAGHLWYSHLLSRWRHL